MTLPGSAPETMRLSAQTRSLIHEVVDHIMDETDERGIPCPGRMTVQEIVDVALKVLLETDPEDVVGALVDRRLQG